MISSEVLAECSAREIWDDRPAFCMPVEPRGWTSNGHWIARGEPTGACHFVRQETWDEVLSIAAHASRESVEFVGYFFDGHYDARPSRGLGAIYEGASGPTVIQVQYERLLEGLSVVRLDCDLFDGDQWPDLLPCTRNPIAGVDASGELVVIINPRRPVEFEE